MANKKVKVKIVDEVPVEKERKPVVGEIYEGEIIKNKRASMRIFVNRFSVYLFPREYIILEDENADCKTKN